MTYKKYKQGNYKEKQKDTMDELFKKIKEGVRAVYSSDKWKKHLETISKFHNYSHRNILLIELQNPDASLVAGYKKWQTEFERQVKKGEKAIKILMPIKAKKELTKLDKKGNPLKDKDGNIEKEEKSFLRFKYVNVFDISQTEGKELDLFKVNELDSSVANKDNILRSIKNIAYENGCDFKFGDTGNAKGYYSRAKEEIVIKENMSDLQTLKTAVHELAHSIIHNPNKNPDLSLDDIANRSKKEIEAESVAYIVLSHLGLDTSDYSFEYIAGWGSNKSEDELSSVLENIKDVSSSVIYKIEENLEKDKHLNLQTCKQTSVEKTSLEDIIKVAKSKDLESLTRNKAIKSHEIEI